MRKKQVIKVFLCWQSDSNGDVNFNIVKNAIDQMNEGQSRCHLEMISDETNNSGATSIADAVFRNISTSDIFLCDMTPSLCKPNEKLSKSNLLMPNSNVLIELGYALCCLPMNRIFTVSATPLPVDNLALQWIYPAGLVQYDINRMNDYSHFANFYEQANAIAENKSKWYYKIKKLGITIMSWFDSFCGYGKKRHIPF